MKEILLDIIDTYCVVSVLAFIILISFFFNKRKQKKERKKQAICDIAELCKGLFEYYKEYQKYPILDYTTDEQNSEIILVLAGLKWNFGQPVTENVARLNPKSINFLEYFDGRIPLDHMITDPWESQYHIAIDTDGDFIIEIFFSSAGEKTTKQVFAPIAVWSRGPDRRNYLGDANGISSWKDLGLLDPDV